MKYFMHTLFLSLLVTQISLTQNDWINQSKFTPAFLKDVCFVDAKTGWAVGWEGMILKSTDGGKNWIYQNSNSDAYLLRITSVNSNYCWVIGFNGLESTILKTTNGGETWNTQITTEFSLQDICFIDTSNGFVLGSSRIFKTTNGGEIWTEQLVLNNTSLYSIGFADMNNAFLVGRNSSEGIILRSTDGGKTWASESLGQQFPSRIVFTNPNNGIIVGGDGLILRTTDGGLNWMNQASGTEASFSSVHFADESNGTIIGCGLDTILNTYSAVLKTTDGGATWIEKYCGTDLLLNGVFLIDSENEFIVGEGGAMRPYHYAFQGIILKSTDSGDSWISQTGTKYDFSKIDFFNENIGIAVGFHYEFTPIGTHWSGMIVRTTDMGSSWTPQCLYFDMPLFGTDCIDDNIAFVVGYCILKTTDGGSSWSRIFLDYDKQFDGVSFINASTGTVVGRDYGVNMGLIMRTTDGGESWINQFSGTSAFLYGIAFSDINNGIAVGENGTILRTTNAGQDWISESLNSFKTLNSVSYHYGSYTIVGDSGVIIRNGIAQESGTTENLNDIYFANEFTGTIVGGSFPNQIILRTTNGGLTWDVQNSSTNSRLSGVYFRDVNNGWAIGDGGIILHTTNGGVSFVGEEAADEIPKQFLLSHNFPNPFNPSTKIQYSVPQFCEIQIKVYDVLGNEIETLVNEEKPAGKYELTWSTANLPSGVYFYQLKAGSFTQTKKMVLLK